MINVPKEFDIEAAAVTKTSSRRTILAEEFFVDSGYYKYHEAYHLLKFANEKQILEKAYAEYLEL